MVKTLKNTYLNPVLWFFVLNLGGRLLFINWYTADFTDGVEYMTYSYSYLGRRSPLYPYLIKIIHLLSNLDLSTSGRLVSIIMASLCVFPLFSIVKKVYGPRAAVYSCLFFTFSPLILQQSLRVLSEPTYLFFFLCALYYCWRVFLYFREKDIILTVLLSGVTALTRLEALLFLPLLAVFFFMSCKRFKISRTIYLFFTSGFFWWVVAAKFLFGDKEPLATYKWGTSTVTFSRFFSHFISYIETLSLIVVYPVFILFLYAIAVIWQKKLYRQKELKIWLLLSGYLFLGFFVAISLCSDWDHRYLTVLVAITLSIAGFGLAQLEDLFKNKWLNYAVIGICLIFSVITSIALLKSDKDYFADIKTSADYIKNNVKDALIYSDEVSKTSFWSGKETALYKREDIGPNRYLILHSYYTDLTREIKFIRGKYPIKVIYISRSRATSIFRFMGITPRREQYYISSTAERQRMAPEHISIVLYISPLK